MSRWLCLSVALVISSSALSQTNFRSNGSGFWDVNTTWQVETPNGSNNWITPAVNNTPTSASNVITIQSGDVVTVQVGVTIDQTTVQAGGTLTVNDPINLVLNNAAGADLIISASGNLNLLGESFISGAGSITMSGNLSVGSSNASGAIVTGTTVGNIRVSSRTYAATSTITYAGTAAQFIGSGNPNVAGLNVFINNASGVSSFANLTFGNNLAVQAGALSISNTWTVNGDLDLPAGSATLTTVVVGATRTLTVKKDVNLTGGTFLLTSGAGIATLTITGILNLAGSDLTIASGAANAVLNVASDITGTNHIQSSGTNSNVSITGTGALTNASPFASGSLYEQITLTRAGGTLVFPVAHNTFVKALRLNSGDAITNDNLQLTGDLNLSAGTSLTFSGHTLDLQGRFNNLVSGGLLIADASSSLTITGAGAFGTLAFSPTGNTLNSLTLNRTGATVITLNSALTVQSSLTLSDGVFANTSGLTLGAASTLSRDAAASFTGAAPIGGPYSIVYSGTTLTTGVETGGSVLNVTSNCTGTVTLGSNLSITGTLSVNSGTFTSSTKDISVATLVNSGTFNAPTNLAVTGLTVSTSFVNNGTFTNNNGSTIIAGAVALTGTNINATNFYNLAINPGATLTPSTTLNILGNFANSGSFVQGTGTVVFSGNSGLKTISGTTSTQFYNLTLNKTSAGISLSVNTAQSVAHNLTLTNGQLDITAHLLSLNAGSTLSRDAAASISTSSPGGGPWNLIYTGATQTTSLEVPASGIILSLTINTNSGTTVTLATGQPLTITNALSNPNANSKFTIGGTNNTVTTGSLSNAGTFTGGANNVTLTAGPFSNSGTFNAPTPSAPIGLTVAGNFNNDGTFASQAGTTLFSGAVSFSGSTIATTNLFNVTIKPGATLTAPSVFNIQGNYVNNGTFVANGGTVVFSGIAGAKTLSGTSGSTFFNLTLNKTNGATSISLSTPQTVSNLLTLTDGIFDNSSGGLTMASGSSISCNSSAGAVGLLTGAAPAGGPYDLTYIGDANVAPSQEVAGSVRNFTTNNTAILTLNAALNLTGQLTVNAGTLTALANSIVTTDVIINGGVFNAPSTSLQLSGNFTNNATFNGGTGTTEFTGGAASILGSTTPTFNNMLISGTLNGPANLTLTGNFTNNSVFNSGAGKVSFIGTSLQNIAGTTVTTFKDIGVTNAASPVSVSVEQNANLQGVLTLGAGAQFDADGVADGMTFTIVSLNDAPTQDGGIATIPGTASVLGKVTAQRFVSAQDNDDRWFSSPVTNAPVSQLQDDFSVTGVFTGTSFPCTGCGSINAASLTYYVEPVLGVFSKGFTATPVKNGTNAETLVPGRGYDAFMWNGVAPFTLDLTGPINQGPIAFTVNYTSTGQPTADGWNLLGNPYPSEIQWNNGPGWTRSGNIDPTVWLWDLRTSSWKSYNYMTAVGNLPNGTIATGQAFWVVATSAAPSMSINEQAKTALGGSYFRTNSPVFQGMQVSLMKGKSQDDSFILFDDRATPAYDQGFDSPKLETGREKLFMAPLDEQRQKLTCLAVNGTYNKDIPLFLHAEADGDYAVRFSTINQYVGLGEWHLVDVYAQRKLLLSESTSYEFTTTPNVRSREGRFFLSTNPDALMQEYNKIQLTCYPNPASAVINVEVNAEVPSVEFIDGMGRTLGQVPMVVDDGVSKGSIFVRDLPVGIYFVKSVVNGRMLTGKVIKN